jgi:hypothetical protein
MPVNYRPDLLPFALPTRIGLPYHGLVRSDVLTLPDSSTRAYPATHEGTYDTKRSICQRGRNYAATVDSTGEPATYRWQNYALLSGEEHEIGGQQLGAGSWIYSDANHSWRVRLEKAEADYQITLTAYLVGPFGIVQDDPLTMTEVELDSYTFTPVNRETGVALSSWSGAWRAVLYPPQYGNQVIILMEPPNSLFPRWIEAVSLAITGNGAITGTVGSGISASFTHHKTAAETYGGSIYHVGANLAGAVVESGYTFDQVQDVTYGDEEGVNYTYIQKTGTYSLWVGSIWTLEWDFDYTEKYPTNAGTPTTLHAGSYPDTVSGFGMKPANRDVISAEIDHPGGGVTHYLVHLSAGLVATMDNNTYWTPAVDPVTGAYSMNRADEFYV